MTTITHDFSSARTPARQPVSRGFWPDAGFGLAIILVVLTFALAGIWAGSRLQASAAWQTPEAWQTLGGFENNVPPEMSPLTTYDFDPRN
jgi:hypothetical protein